jgi:hypothetical protein
MNNIFKYNSIIGGLATHAGDGVFLEYGGTNNTFDSNTLNVNRYGFNVNNTYGTVKTTKIIKNTIEAGTSCYLDQGYKTTILFNTCNAVVNICSPAITPEPEQQPEPLTAEKTDSSSTSSSKNTETASLPVKVTTTVPAEPLVTEKPIISETMGVENLVTEGSIAKETTAPQFVEAPASSPGIPVMNLIACIAGIAILTISVVHIRRWLRYRQNPGLFRKYK